MTIKNCLFSDRSRFKTYHTNFY